MTLFCDAVVAVNAAVLAAFGWALVSLRRLPLGRRPRVVVYDRTGRPMRARQLEPPAS